MTQSQWAEPVDKALLNITVTPERYAAADVDRYAAADDSRYAAVAPDRYRYAAAGITRASYASAARYPSRRYSSRYLHADRYATPAIGGMKLKRLIISPPPARQPQAEEQLLWVPSSEFERCFEEWDLDTLWAVGDVLSFDDAVECMRWQGYEEEDEIDVCTISVESERDTFLADDWCDMNASMPFELALALREALATEPYRSVQVLEPFDLLQIFLVIGGGVPQMPTEVADAIANDPDSGLGGAALDYMVWRIPGKFGAPGARLEEVLTKLGEDDYLRLNPVENLLLFSGSLHPGTTARPPHEQWGRTLYPMTGCYVVSLIGYHSDLEGTVVGGWRSVWLEPTETPAPWTPTLPTEDPS